MNATIDTIDLSKLKNGQVKQLGDYTVLKASGVYQISSGAANGQAWYERDEKTWFFSVPGLPGQHSDNTWRLEGATAKTVVAEAIVKWDELLEAAVEPEEDAEEPADEATDEDEATQEPSKELAIIRRTSAIVAVRETRREEPVTDTESDVTTLDYMINTKGGHAPHRAAAILRVLEATGAAVNSSHGKGARYREDQVWVHALAEPEVIELAETLLESLVPAMEKMADAACREVSRRAKASGGHHSHLGALARRGYMRGFGAGVADVLTNVTTWSESQSEVTTQAFDRAEWLNGHGSGVVFAQSWLTEMMTEDL